MTRIRHKKALQEAGVGLGVLGCGGWCGGVLVGVGSESNTRLVAPGESRMCMPLNVMENVNNSQKSHYMARGWVWGFLGAAGGVGVSLRV